MISVSVSPISDGAHSVKCLVSVYQLKQSISSTLIVPEFLESRTKTKAYKVVPI